MDLDTLQSDITAESGGEEDANWRDVVPWLMLRWSLNSSPTRRLLLKEFIRREFIFDDLPIPTTIDINNMTAADQDRGRCEVWRL